MPPKWGTVTVLVLGMVVRGIYHDGFTEDVCLGV
jgi:hypothetical protein